MITWIKRLLTWLATIGIDAVKMVRFFRGLPRFVRDGIAFARHPSEDELQLRLSKLHPILDDRDDEAGEIRGHYFHQDLWAARKIFLARPDLHVDVGSRLDGFVAHVLTFMPVTVVDIRPLTSSVPGVTFVQSDATTLAEFPNDSVPSASSLHAVEHFGLGRYEDPVRPGAWKEAIAALERILAPGGRLYLSVPVGRERLEFNAHRVFDPRRILDAGGGLDLVSFAAVSDDGELVDVADPDHFRDAEYACGLFEFTKCRADARPKKEAPEGAS